MMTYKPFEMNCQMVGGKAHLTIKTAHDYTHRFVEIARARFGRPFSVTYNAGQDGDWEFDSCQMILDSDAQATALVASLPPR
jgi:hypothetical protein